MTRMYLHSIRMMIRFILLRPMDRFRKMTVFKKRQTLKIQHNKVNKIKNKLDIDKWMFSFLMMKIMKKSNSSKTKILNKKQSKKKFKCNKFLHSSNPISVNSII